MVKLEQISEHKSTHIERERVERHKPPSRTSQTTTDKLTVMLSLHTLKDIDEKLEPYKRSNDTPLTTLTRLLHHYERTSKLLPSLNLDSQIFNQSSQAIQSTLKSLNTLFSFK